MLQQRGPGSVGRIRLDYTSATLSGTVTPAAGYVSTYLQPSSSSPWVIVHADLPCAANGVYQTKYNQDGLSRTGVANTAACQAICAASSACDFFSYSSTHGPQKCATYYRGTCAVGEAAFVGDGYTTYAKPPVLPPSVSWAWPPCASCELVPCGNCQEGCPAKWCSAADAAAGLGTGWSANWCANGNRGKQATFCEKTPIGILVG